MDDFAAFARDLRAYSQRKELEKALRKEIRKPVPRVRLKIKARALSTLPKRGGLNKWVSRTRITAQIRFGRAFTVRLIGRRQSASGQSDLKRLDKGRVRHPSWGRRGRGQWHVQRVTSGFFTAPAVEFDEWRVAIDRALDESLEVIRRG